MRLYAIVETTKFLELLAGFETGYLSAYIQKLPSFSGDTYIRGEHIFAEAYNAARHITFQSCGQSTLFNTPFGRYTVLDMRWITYATHEHPRFGDLKAFYTLLEPIVVIRDDLVNMMAVPNLNAVASEYGFQSLVERMVFESQINQVITHYAYGHQKYQALWHMCEWPYHETFFYFDHIVLVKKLSQLRSCSTSS